MKPAFFSKCLQLFIRYYLADLSLSISNLPKSISVDLKSGVNSNYCMPISDKHLE